MEEKGKGAILVGGTMFPGFDSVEDAQLAMGTNPQFQSKGVGVELSGEQKKSSFADDFRLLRKGW